MTQVLIVDASAMVLVNKEILTTQDSAASHLLSCGDIKQKTHVSYCPSAPRQKHLPTVFFKKVPLRFFVILNENLTFLTSTACRLPMFESSAAMATPAKAAKARRAVVVRAIVVK